MGLLTRLRNSTRTRLARTPENIQRSLSPFPLRSAPPFSPPCVCVSRRRLVFDMTHACNAVRYVYWCARISKPVGTPDIAGSVSARARLYAHRLFLSLFSQNVHACTSKSPVLLQRHVLSFLQTTLSLSRSI